MARHSGSIAASARCASARKRWMRISRSATQRTRADQRRQLAGGAPPREIHLEEAILRVQKAGCACDVLARGASDGRDAERVARDHDRRGEPFQSKFARRARAGCLEAPPVPTRRSRLRPGPARSRSRALLSTVDDASC